MHKRQGCGTRPRKSQCPGALTTGRRNKKLPTLSIWGVFAPTCCNLIAAFFLLSIHSIAGIRIDSLDLSLVIYSHCDFGVLGNLFSILSRVRDLELMAVRSTRVNKSQKGLRLRRPIRKAQGDAAGWLYNLFSSGLKSCEHFFTVLIEDLYYIWLGPMTRANKPIGTGRQH